MVQIILHPLRCWEPWASQHQQTSNQNTAHCADPIHGEIIQHFVLWALAGFSQKSTTLFIIVMRTCCCTFQIKARTGRWCSCCCWAGSARRPLLPLPGWAFLWHRDRHSMTLSWGPGCKWNIAQHSPVPTEGNCEVLHNGLPVPIVLPSIMQRTANCNFPPSLIHLILLHNFQGFSYP